MSHWRDLLMLNKLRTPVGNMRIFICIRIRILHVVQSADPHYTRSLTMQYCYLVSLCISALKINDVMTEFTNVSTLKCNDSQYEAPSWSGNERELQK